MSSKHKEVQTLGTFCQNRSSIKTKIALLTYYKIRFSNWTEILILLLEYLQLMSQVILSPETNFNKPSFNSYLVEVIVYFFKLINPSYLLSYGNSDGYTSTVLVVLLLCTILKFILFGYIICVSRGKFKIYQSLIFLWRWVFKLQGRVFYFIFSSFWVRTIIQANEDDFTIFGMNPASLISIATLMLIMEFSLSLILETQFCFVLPTQNLLCAKNNELQITTLVQKLIIQMIPMIFLTSSSSTPWIYAIFGILMTLIRDYQFLSKLPLYQFKALMIQRALLCMVLALNITYFLNAILDATSFRGANINFIIMTWICISILLVILAHEVLRSRLMSLLTSNEKSSPEILLHKVIASRELRRKEKRPSPMSDEYDLTHLIATNQNIKIEDVFGLDLKNTVPEALSSPHLSWEKLDKIFLQYLEGLLAKYPKNSLVRLHTAYISFKNSEPYTKTIKLAIEVEKNKWSENYLSSTLLLYEIEKSILAEHSSIGTDKNLDFYTYIRSKVLVDDLRKKMLDQTDLYLRVCDNILSDISNIGEIHRSGQSISDLKHSIQKKIDSISKILPEYFISPYLICAEYNLIINHSVVSFEKYCDMYAQRYYKSEKFYKEAHLIEENLYQDTNAFLLLSSQKSDAGKILHTNRSLMNICGGTSSKGFLGSHISSIFTPSLRAYYDGLFKQTIRAGDQKLVNRIHRAFIYNKSKYLIEADFCLKYHPYLTQNLCLDMIIRPVPSNREFLLIKEDGDIEGASREISKLLRLTDFNNSSNRSTLPVRALSEDLFKINTAFNIVHMNGMVEGNHKIFELTKTALSKFKGGQSGSDHHLHHTHTHHTGSPFASTFTPVIKMSQKTAMDIYTAFSTEDQILQLGAYEKGIENTRRRRGGEDDDAYVFYARVEFIHFGNVTMKLVSLRETTNDEDGEGLSKMFSDMEPEKQFFAKKSHFVKFISSDSKNFSAHKTLQSPMLQSPVLKDLKDEDSNSENHIPEEKDDTQEISTTFRQNAKPVVKRKFVFPLLQKQTTLGETPRQSMNSDSRGLLDGNMSSFRNGPMSPGLTPLSPGPSDRKNLISPHMKKKLSNFHGEANSASTVSEPEMGANNHARDARRKEKVQKYISSHHSSQKSVEKSSNKAFRKAIIKKSYPKSFVVLCLTFYGVILMTFIAQIIMKVVSDSTMKDLQLKKDLLKNSEQRSYKAALIQINAVGAALQIKGALSSGGVLTGVSTVVTNLQIRLEGMQTANDKMVEYAYSLDQDIQKELFKSDVLMQGTYLDSASTSGIYKTVNNFQAAQEITNAVKSLKGLAQPSSQAGYDMFNYLSNNIMDDFFYKSVQITDLFTASVEDQKSSYQRIIILCLVLTPTFLAGMGFLLAGIIWNQYRIEQKNLKAFIRIKPGGVKDINERLEGFKKNLINEETFEEKWFANLGETVDLVPDRTEKSAATYAKKQSTQVIRYREFRQRYMKYIVRVAFYILVLISITIWDLITTQKAIRVIYNYQDQLQYANFISSRVTAGYASYPVLFLSNNTMKVEHMIAYDALLDAAAQIKAIQSEIPKRFLDVDGEYNPDVKNIIYDNNPTCTNIPSDALTYCKTLVNIGQPVNMIAAAAVYQGILTTKLLDFDNAIKTSQGTLLAAAYLNVQTFLPNFYLIASEAQMIADVMDKSLTKKIAETEDNRTVIIIIFSCMLVIVSVLIWFHILQVIREVYNDFKKVLQIFPPSLVLSSYLIKKFLKRTSNEPLLIG